MSYFSPKSILLTMNTTPQENLLDDLDVHLVRAGAGLRFANYLLDLIGFVIFIGIFAVISPSIAAIFFVPFVPAIVFAIYISLLETILKGKTIGKLLTGTRAVYTDGTPINAGTAWSRGFSRIVPFEPFSALGSESNPWHDRWTNTYVIVERESRGI
jgi:uncharacterized RDD family membrane protein YckC